VASNFRFQDDLLANHAARHLIHFGHHGIQVEDSTLQNLLAAEGEKLACERGRAFCRPGNLANLEAFLAARGQTRGKKLAIAQDDT
jgi:hypothetical protein